MNKIAEFLNLIASGIDPTTGETFDIKTLKENKEVHTSLKNLNKVLGKKQSSCTYKDYEKDYPNYVIIMREGYFFSAHNDSAQVLNQILNYKLCEDMYHRVTTGGPNIDKITGTLKENKVKFIVVEHKEITQQYNGE